ncbi:MAG: fimbrillin family protein [Odoribacter sp.]
MNARFLTMTLVMGALVFIGCSKDENEPVKDNWNGEIRLCSGVTVRQTRTNNADVPDKQIANNQTVQVVVTKQTADQKPFTGYNQSLTAQGDGTFSTPDPAMYYPESGMGVSIYAFHPATAAESFVINTDQSTDDNYFSSDLLYSDINDYARQKDAHSLTFKHKLSKLTYTLEVGTGTPTITGATVMWKNVCNTVSFDKTTGTVTNAINATTIKPHATYGTIIAPQTVASGTALLEVTLPDGGVFTYKPTADQQFVGGKKYNYLITVNLTGLTVTSTITDWEAVTTVNGSAEMD